MSKLKNNKGITLVALIITIIVLLILAMVSIRLVMNGGIIDRAERGTQAYTDSEIKEQIKLACSEWQTARWDGTAGDAKGFVENRLKQVLNLQDNEISVDQDGNLVIVTMNGLDYTCPISGGEVTAETAVERAKNSTAKADSYVGSYADIDKDGTVDGVIFVDLLTGSVRDTQQWYNANGAYTLPTDVTTENVNKYYISQSSYTDSHFGTHEVISPKTTNGKQRFYIMQLSNFTTPAKTDGTDEENYSAYTTYYWYKNAYSHMSPLITSNAFGTGKENTRKMIEKWNAAGTENGYTDSAQDKQDIWKHIQTKYNEGWFIPSRAEWAAFANEIGGETPITTSNYNSTYGLSNDYWSSSQYGANNAWLAYFYYGYMYDYRVIYTFSVRLATTF